MKVKAHKQGFFGNKLIEPGTVFEIDHPRQLGKWMEVLEPEKMAELLGEVDAQEPAKKSKLEKA